jgi:hypothetical protein
LALVGISGPPALAFLGFAVGFFRAEIGFSWLFPTWCATAMCAARAGNDRLLAVKPDLQDVNRCQQPRQAARKILQNISIYHHGPAASHPRVAFREQPQACASSAARLFIPIHKVKEHGATRKPARCLVRPKEGHGAAHRTIRERCQAGTTRKTCTVAIPK